MRERERGGREREFCDFKVYSVKCLECCHESDYMTKTLSMKL